MESLALIPHDDPRLRQRSEEFAFDGKSDPIALARQLTLAMTQRAGIGLSACQAGVMTRAFVLWSDPPLAMFNPVVVASSDETVVLDEGCLSFPHLTMTVKRPKNVRVRFQSVTGETITRRFEGLTARVVQHEIDHLDGKLFFDYVSRPKIESAMRRARKFGQTYVYSDIGRKKK